MPRMIELIRQSAVPANIMRAAAKGALALPPAEMIEILVYLADNPVFGQQCRMTLAGWDESSALAAAADPQTPPAVLDYFSKPDNLRPRLLPALLENPSVAESRLMELAQAASPEVVGALLASARVQQSADLLHALSGNQKLDEGQAQRVEHLLAQLGEKPRSLEAEVTVPYEVAHAAEIAAEEGKPFTLVTLTGDVLGLGFEDVPSGQESAPVALEVLPALAAKAAELAGNPDAQKRLSAFQKIARLTVGQRVQLAMKGSREERFILIRDGAKVVALAVLENHKLTENEVELFATMRNVQESVLRGIALKRRFMKVYAVVKSLLNNPRTPIDVGLPLLAHLLVNDLRLLSVNKNVTETIRKLATKLYNQKRMAVIGR